MSGAVLAGLGMAAVACSDDPRATSSGGVARALRWVQPLSVSLPHDGPIGGVVVLRVAADRPTRLVIHHDDGEELHSFEVPGASVVHQVPFLGLAPGAHRFRVDLIDGGRSYASEWVSFQAEGPPEVQVDVLQLDPARAAPGWLLVPLTIVGEDRPTYTVFLDEQLRIVWWADPEGRLSESQLDGFELVGNGSGGKTRVDLFGRVVERILPDIGPSHHDLHVLPDGSWWTLVEHPRVVPSYPVDYDDLAARQGPVTLRDSYVTRVDPTGAVIDRVALGAVLDTEKIGFDSLRFYERAGWFDWAHANGIWPTDDGGVLVTARHLDAVLRFDAELELMWILGPHDGWGEDWAPYLLEPVGDLRWPLHPHAPEVLPDGTIVVFDNGNDGHTPYQEPPAAPPTSRAVALAVEGGTVREVWSMDATATGPLYCAAVGDVDVDEVGRVLVDYGFVTSEEGVANVDAGRGNRSVRLVETYLGEDAPVRDVRLSTYPDLAPDGLHAFRVQRIPSLYGPLPLDPTLPVEEVSHDPELTGP